MLDGKTVQMHGTDYLGNAFAVSASVAGGMEPPQRVAGIGDTSIACPNVGILTFNWSEIATHGGLYYPSLAMTPYNYQQSITAWGVFVENTVEPGNPYATCILETTEYWT